MLHQISVPDCVVERFAIFVPEATYAALIQKIIPYEGEINLHALNII